MTQENIATMINPTEVICGRCEIAIRNIDEAVVRECEQSAPYVPALYCSEACSDAANEDAHEAAYTPRG